MKRPKRKAIPAAVKWQVCEKQEQKCVHCGKPLGTDPVEYDHRPALWTRPYNSKDYVPGQLDPLFIDALHVHCHKARTFGTKHRRQGADITEKHRMDRLGSATSDHERAMRAKRPGKAPRKAQDGKQPWPKGRRLKAHNGRPWSPKPQYRPIPSRPFQKSYRPLRPQ